MNADIESAARHLFEFIRAPRGVVGVLAWPDLTQPRIRVFVTPGSWHQMAAVPAEFEGYPVEMMACGDITPFCIERIEDRRNQGSVFLKLVTQH